MAISDLLNSQLHPALGLTLMLLIAIPTGIYMKGRLDANVKCATNAALGVSKSVKDNGKIKQETNSMDESAADSYLNKWMRD